MKYWWHYLIALPTQVDSTAFKRIYRIITDKTRYAKTKDDKRLHEFYNPKHETHLTVSVWENFSIFDNFSWINHLINKTEIKTENNVVKCNWSYEWENRIGRKVKLCDVVINFQTQTENSIIVVEAKNKGKLLGPKDLDINYYMSIEDFEIFDNVYLIYCVDETVLEITKSQMEKNEKIGVITWQELCEIQIKLLDTLEIDPRINMFMKSSIFAQYHRLGLEPKTIESTYIENELDMEAYVELECNSVQMQEKLWEIK